MAAQQQHEVATTTSSSDETSGGEEEDGGDHTRCYYYVDRVSSLLTWVEEGKRRDVKLLRELRSSVALVQGVPAFNSEKEEKDCHAKQGKTKQQHNNKNAVLFASGENGQDNMEMRIPPLSRALLQKGEGGIEAALNVNTSDIQTTGDNSSTATTTVAVGNIIKEAEEKDTKVFPSERTGSADLYTPATTITTSLPCYPSFSDFYYIPNKPSSSTTHVTTNATKKQDAYLPSVKNSGIPTSSRNIYDVRFGLQVAAAAAQVKVESPVKAQQPICKNPSTSSSASSAFPHSGTQADVDMITPKVEFDETPLPKERLMPAQDDDSLVPLSFPHLISPPPTLYELEHQPFKRQVVLFEHIEESQKVAPADQTIISRKRPQQLICNIFLKDKQTRLDSDSFIRAADVSTEQLNPLAVTLYSSKGQGKVNRDNSGVKRGSSECYSDADPFMGSGRCSSYLFVPSSLDDYQKQDKNKEASA